MEWKKAKNLILCVLVFANLFLMINLLTLEKKRWGEQVDKALIAAENLIKRGHTVDSSLIEKLPVSLRVYDVMRSSDYEKRLARSVLGECEVKSMGGGIEIYFNDSGRFVFRSGGNFLCELYGRNIDGDFADGAEDIVELMKSGSYDMEKLGDKKVFFAVNAGGKYETDGYGVTVEQTTRGVQMSGKLIDTASAERKSISPDYAKALIKLASEAEDEGKRLDISGVDIVYVCDSINTGENILEPALRVSERNGEILVNLNSMEITKK